MSSSADMARLALPLTGGSIPSVGFGCWKVPKDTCAEVVEKVIRAGYRHIDCACDYGNEQQVGLGIKRAIEAGICSREDLHVTSKLWNTYHAPEHVKLACQKSLDDLGLSYVDLYLIHFPIAMKFVPFEKRYPPEWFHDPDAPNPGIELAEVPVYDTWRAMEGLVDAGLAKSIGLSNFNCQGLRDVFNYARIKPAVLQIEVHPLLQQDNLIRLAKTLGVHVTAFSPLGHGSSYWDPKTSALYSPIVQGIAQKHGKTPAQVILKWGIQRECSVIPKSENEDRIKENIDLFTFELSTDDMEAMKGANINHRFNDPAVFCEKSFNTFVPIFD